MGTLFEISHPAHVHMFKNAILKMYSEGLSPIVYAKEKDSVIELLYENDIDFINGGPYKSNFDKAISIFKHVIILKKLLKLHDIQRTIGVAPIHTSLSTINTNVHSYGFTDTEHAKEQIALYWPTTDYIFTPNSFRGRWTKNQIVYPGVHELSYLHPSLFVPSPKYFEANNIPLENLILYRMINWDATHDWKINFSPKKEIELIKTLEKKYNILISYEGNNPPSAIRHLVQKIPKSELHNLIYYADLCISSGSTTASEAVCLGTPTIYTNPISLGYLDNFEEKGLLFSKNHSELNLKYISSIININQNFYSKQVERFISSSINLNDLIYNISIGKIDVNFTKAFIKQYQLSSPITNKSK